MAKILLYTDNHFCFKSSGLPSIGNRYSYRLDNQIQTLNWVQELAEEKECEAIICLGDFFDKPTLNDIELTATKDIVWSSYIKNYFLIGNHESSSSSLACSSTKVLQGRNKFIINTPTSLIFDTTQIHFIPYIIESDRKLIGEYLNKNQTATKHVIISHNDIKGIQMGPVVSKTGFDIKDIEANCDLFLNGHLHNGTSITNKIINLGNITGLNFGEDAFKYKHCAYILDTDSLQIESIENPYAINYYKLNIKTEKDFSIVKELKQKCVLNIMCLDTLKDGFNKYLEGLDIVSIKWILNSKSIKEENNDFIESLTTNHIDKFKKFMLDNSEDYNNYNLNILNEELIEVCK